MFPAAETNDVVIWFLILANTLCNARLSDPVLLHRHGSLLPASLGSPGPSMREGTRLELVKGTVGGQFRSGCETTVPRLRKSAEPGGDMIRPGDELAADTSQPCLEGPGSW